MRGPRRILAGAILSERGLILAAGILGGLLAGAGPARAFDPADVYRERALVLSAEAGYGAQFEVENTFTGLDFANAGIRLGLIPFGIAGPGPLQGALEVGLEPIYQRYVSPVRAFYAGLAAVARYHFTSFGRLVPYVELAGAAGGTDLRVAEQQSAFGFLLFGGAGLSYFVADRTAVYAGYRFQHVSNAYTSSPNVGINSNSGVVGVSYFFE
jgi:opacity protein-like surface antigen